jgi:hypothetical protein
LPLVKELMKPEAIKFDIVVDESPNSSNAKERGWAAMRELIPYLMQLEAKKPLPSAVWAEVVRYMPIPAGPSEKIIAAITAEDDPQKTADAEEQKQLAKAAAVAKIDKDAADGQLKRAQSEKTLIESGVTLVEGVRTLMEPLPMPVVDENGQPMTQPAPSLATPPFGSFPA